MVDAAFAQRRKTLRAALRAARRLGRGGRGRARARRRRPDGPRRVARRRRLRPDRRGLLDEGRREGLPRSEPRARSGRHRDARRPRSTCSLGVGPPAHDGFHPLATVYQAVGLYDEVTVHDADEVSVTVDRATPRRPSTTSRSTPTNIAVRGRAAARRAPRTPPRAPRSTIAQGHPGRRRAWPAAAPTPPPRCVACDRLWDLRHPARGAARAGRGARQRRAVRARSAAPPSAPAAASWSRRSMTRGAYWWVVVPSAPAGCPRRRSTARFDDCRDGAVRRARRSPTSCWRRCAPATRPRSAPRCTTTSRPPRCACVPTSPTPRAGPAGGARRARVRLRPQPAVPLRDPRARRPGRRRPRRGQASARSSLVARTRARRPRGRRSPTRRTEPMPVQPRQPRAGLTRRTASARCSTTSASASARASASASSAATATARPRCCGCSPAWRSPTPAA